MTQAGANGTGEACPICHAVVAEDEPAEWVPVCPLVYPDVEGLRPTVLGRRVAER